MYQAECKDCGAIFTLDQPEVPDCVECMCQSKQFEILTVA